MIIHSNICWAYLLIFINQFSNIPGSTIIAIIYSLFLTIGILILGTKISRIGTNVENDDNTPIALLHFVIMPLIYLLVIIIFLFLMFKYRKEILNETIKQMSNQIEI